MIKKVSVKLVVAALLAFALAWPGSAAAQTTAKTKHDRLWDGILIGAGVGALVGLGLAPRAFCSRNDPECTAVVRVAIGLPAIGVGIGVGALADGLHHEQRGFGPVPFRSANSMNLKFRF
jgi:hypothetical protein